MPDSLSKHSVPTVSTTPCNDQKPGTSGLSGTGTEGATLRLYLETYDPDVANHRLDAQSALSELIKIAGHLSELQTRTGRAQPTVIT